MGASSSIATRLLTAKQELNRCFLNIQTSFHNRRSFLFVLIDRFQSYKDIGDHPFITLCYKVVIVYLDFLCTSFDLIHVSLRYALPTVKKRKRNGVQ